jgi:hypothetical protein
MLQTLRARGRRMFDALFTHPDTRHVGRALVPLILTTLVIASAGAAMPKLGSPEAKAIRSAITGYVAMPGSPAAKDNKVVSIAVSTLDPRYASARLSSKTAGASEMVLHRSMGVWWVVEFGSLLGCDAAPKVVLADLGVGCTPPDGVAWINDCGPLVSAPHSLVLTCADANYELVRLSWHGWGGAAATAAGSARANDCKPNCAAGHFHSYPITARASRLSVCGRARYYARLTITYASRRPAGIAKHDIHALGC